MSGNEQASSWKLTVVDLRMAVSVLVCCLVATALSELGVKFPVGEARLEIIQKMTACFSCLLCCQDDVVASKKAGVNRALVTAVGGVVGVLVVALDMLLGGNAWVLCLLLVPGLLATMSLCRAVGAPVFNARIGAISFLLVSCTLTGTLRVWYAVFRLVSTVFGALVVLAVTHFLPGRA